MRTLKDVLYEKDEIYVLDFHELTQELKDKIDKYLIKICEGSRNIDLETVKKRFYNRITKNESHQIAMISEFLVHLLLNTENYKPCFLFFNLEDTGYKKGFDGLYIKYNETDTWLLESKSTLEMKDSSDLKLHKEEINTGYISLKEKVEGLNIKKSKNSNINDEKIVISPWDNAYNHAKMASSNKSLVDQIDTLANNFTKGIYTQIKDHQIILCGTVFVSNNNHSDKFIVYNNIKNTKNKESKNCIPIAITCRLLDEIIAYIKSETE